MYLAPSNQLWRGSRLLKTAGATDREAFEFQAHETNVTGFQIPKRHYVTFEFQTHES